LISSSRPADAGFGAVATPRTATARIAAIEAWSLFQLILIAVPLLSLA
jgi:hypothetical protein